MEPAAGPIRLSPPVTAVIASAVVARGNPMRTVVWTCGPVSGMPCIVPAIRIPVAGNPGVIRSRRRRHVSRSSRNVGRRWRDVVAVCRTHANPHSDHDPGRSHSRTSQDKQKRTGRRARPQNRGATSAWAAPRRVRCAQVPQKSDQFRFHRFSLQTRGRMHLLFQPECGAKCLCYVRTPLNSSGPYPPRWFQFGRGRRGWPVDGNSRTLISVCPPGRARMGHAGRGSPDPGT
jgi:hypothetical protein